MSTTPASNGSDSDGSSTRKRGFSIPIEEEIEPYVRKRRASSERNRKRLEKLTEEEQNLLRTSINSRERRRMHDLNDALDELRSVLPYSHGATVRRLSKINTIILASNCIRNLNKRFGDVVAENEQLRSMVPEDKLLAIKLPPIRLATAESVESTPALISKSKRQSLSNSPKIMKFEPTAASLNTKKTGDSKATLGSQQSSIAPPSGFEPVFPMALLAAAAFNFHGQPNQTPSHSIPNFPPPPQFCMKRFNPTAFCACVGCFVQNANAAFVNRSIKSRQNR